MDNGYASMASGGVSGFAIRTSILAEWTIRKSSLAQPDCGKAQTLATFIGEEIIDVADIIESGRSLARWGDGDTAGALGLSNKFHRGSASLSSALLRALRSMISDKNVVLGLPLAYLLPDLRRGVGNQRLEGWGLTLALLSRYLRLPSYFADSFVFREQKVGDNRAGPLVDSAGLARAIGNRRVGLVGPEQFVEQGSGLFGKNEIPPIIIPGKDSDQLFGEVRQKLLDQASRKSRDLFLISAGNLSRLLVSDLSDRIQLIDVGQIEL